MNQSRNNPQLIENLFRHESGKMTAVLTKIFGMQNLDFASDVVQETFAKALENWSLNGVPDNPSAWLYRVAKNRATDEVRKKRFTTESDFLGEHRDLLNSEYSMGYTMNQMWLEDEIQDDLLRMMFACCHPELKVENQIPLILKSLCGFTTLEIANALVLEEQAVSKRLYRSKLFFRKRNIRPTFPSNEDLGSRVSAVLTSIYLLFNEGYNATHNDLLIRKDLLNQALYLTKLLSEHNQTAFPEVFAALSLMCFHTARIETRTDKRGDIIFLKDQDRSLWNRELIKLGWDYLNRASGGDRLSSYHFEAAIAYEHCIASSLEETNWSRILAYYNYAYHLHSTPTIALNRLIVYHRVHGLEKTLDQLTHSVYLEEWETDHVFHSFMGDMLLEKETRTALIHYKKALNLAKNSSEQRLLERKMKEAESV